MEDSDSPEVQVPRRDQSLERELQACLDSGESVWVVGDVHARPDILKTLLQGLELSEGARVLLLGDLFDRGPSPRELVDFVRAHPQIATLQGNHEDLLLQCLDLSTGLLSPSSKWLRVGGPETLVDYDLPTSESLLPHDHPLLLDAQWVNTLPQELVLERWRCVHAGYRPGRPLSRQRYNDVMWIRGEFTDSTDILDSKRTILVGHTVTSDLGVQEGWVKESTQRLQDGRPQWLNLDTSLYTWEPGKLSAMDLQSGQLAQCTGTGEFSMKELLHV